MTNPDPGRETKVIDLKGRSVVVRKLIDTQMLLLAREAKLLQRDDATGQQKLDSVDRMYRILQSALAQPSDRDYMEELIVTGDLDLRELMGFVTVFGEDSGDPKPKVRRGRISTKS